VWSRTTGGLVEASPAVSNGVVYVGSYDGKLYAFERSWNGFRGSTDHTGYNEREKRISVSTVGGSIPVLIGETGADVYSSPAVADGVVYIASTDHKLYAYPARQNRACLISIIRCAPLWTASTGDIILYSSPVVANGLVYVGSVDHKLYAFDAAGVVNCSGTPKTCNPLWTATLGNSIFSSPTVSNGVVYVGAADQKLYAFDAAGLQNCFIGNPRTCNPLWTAPTGGNVNSSPAVSNGVVYVGSFDNNLHAYDAAGNVNCSGDPKVCAPLWDGPTGGGVYSSPAVANGVVYVGSVDHKLYAFDAAGNLGCGGALRTCQPLWTATTGDAIFSSPAVANGVVYIGSEDHHLYAFDAGGNTGCAGAPKQCTPLWSATAGFGVYSSPAVANGVVIVGGEDNNVYAFSAAGTTNCSGTPKTCTPLKTITTGGVVQSSPAIADGAFYFGSADGFIYGYAG
jgi:outer membrane protein assembly factor BamB